jgi:hypothetical protein
MNDVPPLQRWKARGRRLLVIFLLFVFVVLVVRAVFDVWEGRRLNEEIASLDKRYGPLDGWNVAPPHVDRAENRARLMRAAADCLTIAGAQTLLLSHGASALAAADAREIADENRDAVQIAIRGARRLKSDWEIEYDGDMTRMPSLLELRYLSTVLASAARRDMEAKHADEAISDVTAGFAEAASLRSARVTIMALVGIAVAAEQIRPLRDILASAEPSAAALTEVARAIDENLVEHPMREAMIAELKRARARWSRIERSQIAGMFTSQPTPPMWLSSVWWLFRPVVRSVARRDLGAAASAIEAASTPRSRRATVVPLPAQVPTGPWWSPSRQLARLSNPDFRRSAFKAVDSADTATAVVGLAAVAVGLRRYRLDHGAYPAALDELAPMYLKAVPLDPFTGRQPEYARDGAGFELRAQVPVGAIGEWKVLR